MFVSQGQSDLFRSFWMIFIKVIEFSTERTVNWFIVYKLYLCALIIYAGQILQVKFTMVIKNINENPSTMQ